MSRRGLSPASQQFLERQNEALSNAPAQLGVYDDGIASYEQPTFHNFGELMERLDLDTTQLCPDGASIGGGTCQLFEEDHDVNRGSTLASGNVHRYTEPTPAPSIPLPFHQNPFACVETTLASPSFSDLGNYLQPGFPSLGESIHAGNSVDHSLNASFDASDLPDMHAPRNMTFHPVSCGLSSVEVLVRAVKYRPKKPTRSTKRGRPKAIPADKEEQVKKLLHDYHGAQDVPLDDIAKSINGIGITAGQGSFRNLKRSVGIVKNNSASQLATSAWPARSHSRRRAARALTNERRAGQKMSDISSWHIQNAGPRNIPRILTPKEQNDLFQMLHLVNNYVKGHLDTKNRNWNWDGHGIIFKNGAKDYSEAWRNISDQFHGASSLLQKKHQLKAFKTIQRIYKQIAVVSQQHDPWVLVYVWKILLYVRGLSERLSPPNAPFIQRFIAYLGNIYSHSHGNTIPLVQLLSLLQGVPLNRTKAVIERLYKRTIQDLESIGCLKRDPVVFSMWSHFHSYYEGEFCVEALATYQSLTNRLLRENTTRLDKRDLLTIAGYMLVVYRERGNLTSVEQTARELIRRTQDQPLNTWGSVTYCYTVASKYLSHVLWSREDYGESWAQLAEAVARLRLGDRECRTRAAQMQGTIANRYLYLGYRDRSLREMNEADRILSSIDEWPADESPWGLSREEADAGDPQQWPGTGSISKDRKIRKAARKRRKRLEKSKREKWLRQREKKKEAKGHGNHGGKCCNAAYLRGQVDVHIT